MTVLGYCETRDGASDCEYMVQEGLQLECKGAHATWQKNVVLLVKGGNEQFK